jgi:hypothetical protein
MERLNHEKPGGQAVRGGNVRGFVREGTRQHRVDVARLGWESGVLPWASVPLTGGIHKHDSGTKSKNAGSIIAAGPAGLAGCCHLHHHGLSHVHIPPSIQTAQKYIDVQGDSQNASHRFGVRCAPLNPGSGKQTGRQWDGLRKENGSRSVWNRYD